MYRKNSVAYPLANVLKKDNPEVQYVARTGNKCSGCEPDEEFENGIKMNISNDRFINNQLN